jgi:PAS domain S-box-containing protein
MNSTRVATAWASFEHHMTHRARANEVTSMTAVRQLTEGLRAALLDAAPDAVVCVTGQGVITLVNDQAERLFGHTRQELAGQAMEILLPDAVKAGHPGLWAGYAADPRAKPMGAGTELSGRRRDGSTFPAEISLSAIDTDDGPLIMAAVRDVTERHLSAERERLQAQAERDRLERELHQSQRLEGLGQLTGGVAHDFNNLLSVIANYAAFVRDEVASQAPRETWESVAQDIQRIEVAAERASELIRQLLAFARRDVIHPRAVNLNETVHTIEQLLARTIGEHLELTTDLAAEPYRVLADPGQIEQVLINLAVNAREAMPSGGKLTIQTANTNVDEVYAARHAGLHPGQYASLKVSDTGTGMPGAGTDQAFEPFFGTRPKGEGTGLSLPTIDGIVTQAGGYVQTDSEPGIGSTVTIWLPAISPAAQPALPGQPPGSQRGGDEIVLVVEDEEALREVTRRILARNGYQVLTAASGPEAIDTAARHPGGIDILLTDVVLPQMTGKETADHIRALCPAALVLFMSGYAEGASDSAGTPEGSLNVIEKPFTATTLLTSLRNAVTADRASR